MGVDERDNIRVGLSSTLIIKQRKLEIDRAISVVVVLDGINKSVVVSVGVLNNFFYAWGKWFWRRSLNSTVVLSVLIDCPRAPFCAGKMQLPVKYADIQIAAAGIIFVE